MLEYIVFLRREDKGLLNVCMFSDTIYFLNFPRHFVISQRRFYNVETYLFHYDIRQLFNNVNIIIVNKA
jgi:hypothetical protein